MLLEVFTPQGPELHLDMSPTHRPVLFLDMSTRTQQGRELHLDVFRLLVACAAAAALQRPVQSGCVLSTGTSAYLLSNMFASL